MRLLFIYFYRDIATFKSGTIILLSKKYNIIKRSYKQKINFELIQKSSFQDDFYSKDIDIGTIIGENGTGKSILINSLRDKNNNYSYVVYENNKKFYTNHTNTFYINKKRILNPKDNLSIIYYSPILDSFDRDNESIINISNTRLLAKNKGVSIVNNLLTIENNDISFYLNMENKIINDYVKIEKIKFKTNEYFFKKIEDTLYTKISLLKKITELSKNDKSIVDEYSKSILSYVEDSKKNELFQNIKIIENLEKVLLDDYLICSEYYNTLSSKMWEKLKTSGKNERPKDVKILDSIISELKKCIHEFKFDSPNVKELSNLYKKWIDIVIKISFKVKNYKNIQLVLRIIVKELSFLYGKKEDRIASKARAENIFRVSEIFYLLDEYSHEFKDITSLVDIHKDLHLLPSQQELILQYHYSSMEKYIKLLTKENIKLIISKYLSYFRINLLSQVEKWNGLVFSIGFYEISKKFSKKEQLQLFIYLNFLMDGNSKKFSEFKILTNENFSNLENRLNHLFEFNLYCKELINVSKNSYDDLSINVDTIIGNERFFKGLDMINYDFKPFLYELNPILSSGQKAILFIFARIENAIKESKNDSIIILFDEADLKLHLEWQRGFLSKLIEFLDIYSKKFYILYATHSPMILSDITDDRIVFLKKDGTYSIEKSIDKAQRTFGANIYDLYHDSFFMDRYMGEFAFNKINDVINIVNLYKISKEIANKVSSKKEKLIDYRNEYNVSKIFRSYKNRYGEHINENCKKVQRKIEDDKEKLEQIAEKIGEPLLRNRVLRDIGKIGDDDKIIESLKRMTPEERNVRLLKYSKQKQIKLLTKLLDEDLSNDKD